MPAEVTICPTLLMSDGRMGIVVYMVICFSGNAVRDRLGSVIDLDQILAEACEENRALRVLRRTRTR
jgi:hypothetical protein